ncbi:DUF6919 domain-containing protein [Kitasatospora sp. NPDC101801]|uniref:DUF6919 domain-containing protein n=1 Tax=Kitasatospora sp. NPDC101801 TaxID=3364103 RepID=UPI00380DD2A0
MRQQRSQFRRAPSQAAHCRALAISGYENLARATSTSTRTGVVVTAVNGQPFTRFGDWMPPETVRRLVWKGAGKDAVAAAERAWQVTLADPDSGPRRALIDALFEAFADPAEARCVRCGCTEDDPCKGGCWWVPGLVTEDVCSACAPDRFDELAAEADGDADGSPLAPVRAPLIP